MKRSEYIAGLAKDYFLILGAVVTIYVLVGGRIASTSLNRGTLLIMMGFSLLSIVPGTLMDLISLERLGKWTVAVRYFAVLLILFVPAYYLGVANDAKSAIGLGTMVSIAFAIYHGIYWIEASVAAKEINERIKMRKNSHS